jgi:hypothetical protein
VRERGWAGCGKGVEAGRDGYPGRILREFGTRPQRAVLAGEGRPRGRDPAERQREAEGSE